MIKEISNKEYQSIPAISHSLLVAIRKKGFYPAFLDSPFNPDREDVVKDCFDIGNAYHTLISAPEVINNFENYRIGWDRIKEQKGQYLTINLPETTWYIYDFGQKRSTLAYSKFVNSMCLTGDDLVLNWKEFELVVNMAKKMREYPLFQAFMTKEVIGFEKSIFVNKNAYGKEIPFKARPDLLVKVGESYVIIDFKSTKAVSYDEMERLGEIEGYDIQVEDYIDIVSQEFNVSRDSVSFICFVQSKEYPDLIRAFSFNSDSLTEARTDIDGLSSDFWDKYEEYQNNGTNAFIEPDIEIHTFKHYERKIQQDLKE